MKSYRFCAGLLFLLAVSVGQARADLITSPSQINGFPLTVDLSQFNTIPAANRIANNVNFMFIDGGVSLGSGVTLTTDDPFAVVGKDDYSLGSNGQLTPANNTAFAGLNDFSGNLFFHFSQPVSQVGAFVNYNPDIGPSLGSSFDAMISALDSSGNVLATYDLNMQAPISTSGFNPPFAFRGISLPTASISIFELSNSFIAAESLLVGVPEPASMTLLGIGLLGLLGHGQRRRLRRMA